jgi:hypothetical protein
MTQAVRVICEIGPKRRTVAGAMDWPGLDRWGTSEDAALATLTAYLPRYADVARRAGLADAFAAVSERHNWWRKVGLRADDDRLLGPDELAAYRADYLDRIRVLHAESRPARTWPLAFLIRRTAQHAMDHAWELEDRDLTPR